MPNQTGAGLNSSSRPSRYLKRCDSGQTSYVARREKLKTPRGTLCPCARFSKARRIFPTVFDGSSCSVDTQMSTGTRRSLVWTHRRCSDQVPPPRGGSRWPRSCSRRDAVSKLASSSTTNGAAPFASISNSISSKSAWAPEHSYTMVPEPVRALSSRAIPAGLVSERVACSCSIPVTRTVRCRASSRATAVLPEATCPISTITRNFEVMPPSQRRPSSSKNFRRP